MNIMTLDIGGTAIKSGIFCDGSLMDVQEIPTEAEKGGRHVVDLAVRIIRRYAACHDFEGIGISTAGQVDSVTGQIIYANDNIPGYTGMKIKGIIENEFGKPAAVLNDVNAAAMGEARFGAGRDEKDFICLTYGTGVGGAIFTGGELYPGSSFSAGEFGAVVVHPEDRDPIRDIFSGCYEQYASVTALVRSVKKHHEDITDGRAVFSRLDDPDVRACVDRWIKEIVYGLTSLIHIFNPSCVILGGGVMEQEYVLNEVRKLLGVNLMESFRSIQVRRTVLGNRAGMAGAAAYLIENVME